ncbi:hypothetical protein IAE16_04175 [Hydrogenobacter sp. T-2]|uniref:DUF2231 domain-containing protein n=1 Tax=Pampinifervens diazotrophicum TaxID=1632018 RepID=UPI002B25EA36|nr:DUF2231 domain-containing protein [Hydrogenobacter sp. T-2]WPM32881.1 hypothetical protein IAE16_04175 [Hydrogenobacter sp. T-2]
MELIKIHPPVVHFAIAMPVALLIIDLYYRIRKKDPDGLHMTFSLLGSLSVVLGAISGMIAYEPIEDKLYQIGIFSTHKYLGLLLAVYFLALLGVRLSFSKTPAMRSLFTVMLLLGTALLFIQGNLGGSVVYDHMVKPWLEK